MGDRGSVSEQREREEERQRRKGKEWGKKVGKERRQHKKRLDGIPQSARN